MKLAIAALIFVSITLGAVENIWHTEHSVFVQGENINQIQFLEYTQLKEALYAED